MKELGAWKVNGVLDVMMVAIVSDRSAHPVINTGSLY
jgi:hypothetical protein